MYTDWPDNLTKAEVMRVTGESRGTVSAWFTLQMIPQDIAEKHGWATPEAAEQISADPPSVETVTEPPVPQAAPANHRTLYVVIALLVALLVGQFVANRHTDGKTEPAFVTDYQLGRNAGLNYVDLVCSEVLDKLAAANDGELKSKDALRIIEVAIPIIQKNTWSPVTDRLTQLQKDGKLDKEQLDKAIKEVKRGLQSCK